MSAQELLKLADDLEMLGGGDTWTKDAAAEVLRDVVRLVEHPVERTLPLRSEEYCAGYAAGWNALQGLMRRDLLDT